MQPRHKYSFRNRELIKTPRLTPTGNLAGEGLALTSLCEIVVAEEKTRLARYFAYDLASFLSDAFGLSLPVRFAEDAEAEASSPAGKLLLLTAAEAPALAPASAASGAFCLRVLAGGVTVVGRSERGTAQGVYHIEDLLTLFGEPTLPLGTQEVAPRFSPRMTHSGTELDTFPDEFLAAVAHAGMDAIIVYAGHPDSHLHGPADPTALWPGTGRGYCDFANLVWRAAGYGLDVYVYSQLICDRAPEAPDAWEYYDASFGRLFREAPGLRGLILCGESFEFPSRDPHTTGDRAQKKQKGDTRPSSGRYPSCDYPEMLSLVRDVCRAYTPDADIVFWSYNFGWTPKEARIALINTLPTDITYLVTFEVWDRLADPAGRRYSVADYTISTVGPARVFCEEAEAAHARGLRFYTMANTGGRTWDSGGAPYIPAPQQWIRRYAAVCTAAEEYGVCGLMENHHYGWLPSPLTLLAKQALSHGGADPAALLDEILVRDFGEGADLARRAYDCFSRGIAAVIPSVTDQYGPYRCGPTYPLTFTQTAADLHPPRDPWAWHPAGGIWRPVYPDEVFPDIDNSLLRLERVRQAAELYAEGVAHLSRAAAAAPDTHREEITRTVAVAQYLACSFTTAAHVMTFNIAKRMLLALGEGQEIPRAGDLLSATQAGELTPGALAAVMEEIARKERENVALALTAHEADSAIGFEPSMEYVFSEENAAWKLAELDRTMALLHEYLDQLGDK